MKHFTKTLITTSLALAFSSCVSDSNNNVDVSFRDTNLGCTDLMAGQNTLAGSVCVTMDDDSLDVTYSTVDGWGLDEVHVWVGDNLDDLPTNGGGNPQVGLFPYGSEDLGGVTSYTVEVPLSDLGGELLCDTVYYLASHAVVSMDGEGEQTETAWGNGGPVGGNSWAMVSEHSFECEEDTDTDTDGEGGSCETAFALGDTTLIDLGLTDSRWGWELGPVSESFSTPIYAGAGQNDLEKGTVVGLLVVVYDGSNLTVTYEMVDGWCLETTHLYVGDNHVDTISPGLYGNLHEDLGCVAQDTYEMTVSGELYLVAHADVCME